MSPTAKVLALGTILLGFGLAAATYGQAPASGLLGPKEAEPTLPSSNATAEEQPDSDDKAFGQPALPANAVPHFGGAAGGMGQGTTTQSPQTVTRMVPRMRQVVEYVAETVSADQLKQYEGYRRTVELLRAAKDDATREKVSEKLTAELDTLFQRDVDRREKEVAEAETRVKKLREQLEKRKTAKKQIIDLHVQTLVNEANGLGFSFPFDTPIAPQQDFGGGGGTYSAPPVGLPTPVPVDGNFANPQLTPRRSSGGFKRPTPPTEAEDR